MWMASSPASQGSSERYSKFRPHRGDRFILIPGPSTTETPSFLASLPSASPIVRKSLEFQEEASAEAVGKHVAGTLPAIPTWSPSPGWARKPCGPSETMISGIPSRSTGAVYQKCEPRQSDAFSSSVRANSRLVKSLAASDTTNSSQKNETGRPNHITDRMVLYDWLLFDQGRHHRRWRDWRIHGPAAGSGWRGRDLAHRECAEQRCVRAFLVLAERRWHVERALPPAPDGRHRSLPD